MLHDIHHLALHTEANARYDTAVMLCGVTRAHEDNDWYYAHSYEGEPSVCSRCVELQPLAELAELEL